MRRSDREIVDPEKIIDVVRRCACCRVGFDDHGEIYIVPLNFGFEFRDGAYVFYFHGAREGRKFDLIRQCPRVGFEMDADYALKTADVACGYSARFRSVIGNGVIRPVDDPAEKAHGLSLLMERNAGAGPWRFDERALRATAVFRLDADQLSCKEHL